LTSFLLVGKTKKIGSDMIEKLIKGVTNVEDLPVVEGMPDVIEAEDRQVIFTPRAQVWKYGTVGQGVDVMRLVWPK
jgi:hypothetical protein